MKEGLASREEFDALNKVVHDVAEEVRKNQKDTQDKIQETIKSALASHPGFTQRQEWQFITPEGKERGFAPLSANRDGREQAIISSMPKELRNQCDEMFILATLLGEYTGRRQANEDGLSRSQVHSILSKTRAWEVFKENIAPWKEKLDNHVRALDTSTSGGVSEWVPTGYTNQFFEFVRLQTRVRSLFPTIAMPRGSGAYDIPIGIGRINTFKVTEQTADTGQTLVTVGDTSNISNKTTLTAVGHGSRVLTSHYAEEDSIVPILSYLREEMIIAMAEGAEDAIMNGDTAGSHEDTDITSATDRRKMWLGLRALANDNSYKTDLSTFSMTNFRGMRKNMGKYGVNPRELVLITGIAGYMKMLNVAEVQTLDKYGPAAVILNGELGRIDGIPIVVSEWVREVLDANGIYNAAGTKTVMHLVNARRFVIGEKRQLNVRLLTEKYADSEQDALQITERLVFSPMYPIASNRIAEMGYNFAY